MLIIGLTGGIACGKSMVSRYFEDLGISIIDTDIIAKQLVEPGQTALNEIIDAFGSDIIDTNKHLNRKYLRDLIFNSTQKRLQLEAILHPKIHAVVLDKLASLEQSQASTYCIIVIPLLFESKSNYPIDKVLLVDCTEQQQLERSMLRDNITRNESMAIMQNQITRQERLEKADDIIKNISDQDSCISQIKQFHNKYLTLSKNTISKIHK